MINKCDVQDLYRALHTTIGEYTFFPKSHIIFMKTGGALGHKANIKSQ